VAFGLNWPEIERVFSDFSNETKEYLKAKAIGFQSTLDSWGRDQDADLERLQAALQEYLDRRISDLETIEQHVSSGKLTIYDTHNRQIAVPIPDEFRPQWVDQLRTKLEDARGDKARLEKMIRP
jgi:hypothetical protein